MRCIIKDLFRPGRAQFLYLNQGDTSVSRWWLFDKSKATIFDSEEDARKLGLDQVEIIPAPTEQQGSKA